MALKKPPTSYKNLRAGVNIPRSFDPVASSGSAPAGPQQPAHVEPPEPSQHAPAAGSQPKYTVRIPYPAPGASTRFDELSDAYGREEAMKIGTRLAMDQWLKSYSESSTIIDKADYPTLEQALKTTRVFSADVMQSVTRRIDPLGHRAPSYIAQRICLSAMSAFLRE